MRELIDAERARAFIVRLGRRARGPGTVYLTGGATAVLMGWRAATKDLDLKLDPEPAGAFEAIRDLKEELAVNVELAAPDDFIPAVPGWRERSLFIAREGPVDFLHYDPVGQALAKVERGHAQDLADVRALHARGLIRAADLTGGLAAIAGDLLRYPAIDAATFAAKVEETARALAAVEAGASADAGASP